MTNRATSSLSLRRSIIAMTSTQAQAVGHDPVSANKEPSVVEPNNTDIVPAPTWLRAGVSGFLLILVGLAVFPTFRAIYLSPSSPAPVPVPGLESIAIACVSLLAVLNVSWEGVRGVFSKVGPFEFRAAERTEQATALAETEAKLKLLQTNVETAINDLSMRLNELSPATGSAPRQYAVLQARSIKAFREELVSDDLARLLQAFLDKYSKWSFSAARIQNWGSRQPGFDRLATISLADIHEKLRQLVASDLVRIRVSKTGASLYRSALTSR
jgi:hypothetical protein